MQKNHINSTIVCFYHYYCCIVPSRPIWLIFFLQFFFLNFSLSLFNFLSLPTKLKLYHLYEFGCTAASNAECILYYHIQLHVIVKFFEKLNRKKIDIECRVEIRALLNWTKYMKKKKKKSFNWKKIEKEKKRKKEKELHNFVCAYFLFIASHRISHSSFWKG